MIDLGVILHRLNLLLSVSSVRVNLNVAVGSVEALVLCENKGVNLHSESVSLNETLP
jgi:hypothetical protein